MLFGQKLFEPQPSLTDGRTPIQKRDPGCPATVLCGNVLTAEVILACTRASCSGSKQLSRVNYTFPHSTRVVLMSCGCFGFVRYVSDFIGASLSEPHSSVVCDKVSVYTYGWSAFRIYVLHSNYSN